MIPIRKIHQRLREIGIEQDIRQDVQSCPRCGLNLSHPISNNPTSIIADVRICCTCKLEEHHSKYTPPTLWKFAAELGEESMNDMIDAGGCA